MSRNGSYAKSMNGIVSFDDGSGTTIEGNEINTDIINCNILNAQTEINTNTTNTSQMTVDYILTGANPNISVLSDINFNTFNVQSSYVPTNNSDLCNKLYVDTVATAGGSILPLTNVFTGTMNTFNNKIKVSNITYDYNSIVSANIAQPVTLFNTTTGIISVGPIVEIKNNTIAATGTNKLYIGDSNGDVTIANGRTSGTGKSITLGGGVQIIANGEILCENGIQLDTLTNYIDCKPTATINVFNTLSTGIINFCNTITSATLNMCNSFIFKQNSITSKNINDTITLFNNLTSGTMNIGTGITDGIINIGTNITTGAINLCNGFKFLKNSSATYSIESFATNDIIKLFNNATEGFINIGQEITTGTIVIGNITGTTAGSLGNILMGNGSNNSNTQNNGRVTIYKLQIGNSPILRNIRYGSVTNTAQTAVVSFSPAFPSGQVPFIIGSIQGSSTTLVFSLIFSSVTVSSFRYTKTQTAGAGGVGAATEGFHYYAWSD